MNTSLPISSSTLENAVSEVAVHIARQPAAPVGPLTERKAFHELAACILGSQVSFEQALAAANRLRSVQLIEAVQARVRRPTLIRAVRAAVRGGSDTPGEYGTYRFWRSKSTFIVESAFEIYANRNGLLPVLHQVSDQKRARECITAMATGVGPKQASLFLRNTGFGSGLAILDVHVLRFMASIGLTASTPRSIASIRQYEALEAILCTYARTVGWSLQVLDQAIWITMRVAQRLSPWQW